MNFKIIGLLTKKAAVYSILPQNVERPFEAAMTAFEPAFRKMPARGSLLTFSRRLLYRVAKDYYLDHMIPNAHTLPGFRRRLAVAPSIGNAGPDHKSAAGPRRGRITS